MQLADFKGKVAYLDFWASWCGPCIKEIKASEKIKANFKNQEEVVFIYISLDEKVNDWHKAIAKYQIGGVHLRDNIKSNDSVAKMYGSTCIPSTFIIGRDGNFYAIQPPRPSENNGKDLIKILEAATSRSSLKY